MEKELIFDFVGDFSDHVDVLEPNVLLRQSEYMIRTILS